MHFCATPLVLIAENDPLVTACYEDIITDAGASVGASFRSCAEAEEWLSDHYPDAAIVGITLQDGSSVPLAKTVVRAENSVSGGLSLFCKLGGH